MTPTAPPTGPPGGLTVTGLTVTIGTATVLQNINLAVPAGHWTTITGPPGAGKSVLLQALAGLVASSGTILIDGRPARDTTDPPGVVLQDYALLPLLTAAETIALPLQARGRPRPEIKDRTRQTLDALGLSRAARQLVSTLSGGQRQRVAIARALAPHPALLLLDEPTAELDAANRANVLDLLRAEADRGAALLVVTHDPAILDRSNTVMNLAAGGPLALTA